jgi:metal-dependent amidase/aminoacylase/carboxypeptidase family protein
MTTLAREWTEEIDRRRESLVALRRDFHRHPELSFEERRTAEIVAERLHAAKLQVRTGLGRTGVVGVLHGDRPGRTIAWRADIDALPLTETFAAPFASSTAGVMHAASADLFDVTTEELGAHALNDGPPVMASDDMSLFLQQRPGCYFRVGIAPTDSGSFPHHAPEFQMNEDGLPVGLRLGLSVTLHALAG